MPSIIDVQVWLRTVYCLRASIGLLSQVYRRVCFSTGILRLLPKSADGTDEKGGNEMRLRYHKSQFFCEPTASQYPVALEVCSSPRVRLKSTRANLFSHDRLLRSAGGCSARQGGSQGPASNQASLPEISALGSPWPKHTINAKSLDESRRETHIACKILFAFLSQSKSLAR